MADRDDPGGAWKIPPGRHLVGRPAELLLVAWRFAEGSRIGLSLAGADADHFVQTPYGRRCSA
jgi:hypothetical protein